MTLYSYKGKYPRPLPHRIKFSDGRTKTDVSTFTDKDIADAGYIPVKERPIVSNNKKVMWSKDIVDWLIVDIESNPRPYDSWLFNENTNMWEAPVSYPQDGNKYYWDEKTLSWKTKEEMIKVDIWNFNKYK